MAFPNLTANITSNASNASNATGQVSEEQFRSNLILAIVVASVQVVCTILVACFGGTTAKEEVKALFAFKAPATLLALFWKDALIHSVKLVLLGNGDGKVYEDSVDPASTGADLEAWVLRFSATSAFIFLVCTMVPLGNLMKTILAAAHFDEHRSLLLASFKMAPCWSFKSMVLNLLADWDKHLSLSPAWIGTTCQAVGILTLCSIISMILPAEQDGQSCPVAVLALAGASLNAGVAYSFSNIGKYAAGNQWDVVLFQTAYAPCMLLLCLAITLLLHGVHVKMTSDFAKKLMAFLKVVPPFVAAWACQALGQAIAKNNSPSNSDAWDVVLHQLMVAGNVGLIALFVVVVVAYALNCMPASSNVPVVRDYFGTVAGLNVGWAWKTLGIDIYDALGQHYQHLLALTFLCTLTLPLIASGLLALIQFGKPQKASELMFSPRSIEIDDKNAKAADWNAMVQKEKASQDGTLSTMFCCGRGKDTSKRVVNTQGTAPGGYSKIADKP